MADLLLTKGKLEVDVLFDTVSIKISCGDDYAAQVVFDDIVDRLRRGEGLTLRLTQTEPLPEKHR